MRFTNRARFACLIAWAPLSVFVLKPLYDYMRAYLGNDPLNPLPFLICIAVFYGVGILIWDVGK